MFIWTIADVVGIIAWTLFVIFLIYIYFTDYLRKRRADKRWEELKKKNEQNNL